VYGWAFITPAKKLFYNLLVTSVSFLFALLIALVQILGIVQSQLELSGPFWDFIANTGERFEFIGAALVVCFLLGWLGSYLYYLRNGKQPLETESKNSP
jgi:high-affinity nickel-transport protein